MEFAVNNKLNTKMEELKDKLNNMMEELKETCNIEFEPKRIGRFRVDFPKELNIESFLVQSANKPKWVNGKWENLTISLIDIISPSTSQLIFNNLISKLKADINYSFDYNLIALDPIGDEVEKWTITTENIDVDFGDLNYNREDISVINLYITPKNCVINC